MGAHTAVAENGRKLFYWNDGVGPKLVPKCKSFFGYLGVMFVHFFAAASFKVGTGLRFTPRACICSRN